MNSFIKKVFKEIPDFLKILGFKDAYLDDENEEWIVEFLPSKDITHSNGSIVQGGFVSGMLDASMSQYLIFLAEGKMAPLTLDLDVKFLKSCEPNKMVLSKSKVVKKGKSIAFTSGKLIQDDCVIAVATSTSKLVSIQY